MTSNVDPLARSRRVVTYCHVVPAMVKVQLGPQCAMLKEGPAPMTAHKTCTEAIIVGREMSGNKGKDV